MKKGKALKTEKPKIERPLFVEPAPEVKIPDPKEFVEGLENILDMLHTAERALVCHLTKMYGNLDQPTDDALTILNRATDRLQAYTLARQP